MLFPSTAGTSVASGPHFHFDELQIRNIPKVFRIRRQEGEFLLDGLRREPDILDTEVMTAAGSGELRGENAENLRRFSSDADQRFSPHPPKCGCGALLFSGVG